MALLKWRCLCLFLIYALSPVCPTYAATIYAATTVNIYSSHNCTGDSLFAAFSGPDNGSCVSMNYTGVSFEVLYTETDCVVTYYAADLAFCSSTNRSVAQPYTCYFLPSIGGYSIDGCAGKSSFQSSSVAGEAPSSPSTTAASSATRATVSPSPSQTSTGPATGSSSLSTGAKAGIGIGVSLGALLLIGLAAWLLILRPRRRRKSAEAANPAGQGPKQPFSDKELITETTRPDPVPMADSVPVLLELGDGGDERRPELPGDADVSVGRRGPHELGMGS